MDQAPDDNVVKPRSTREDAVEVVRRLREGGHVAYFAGGCVRDTLLGRPPKDYDVATDAPPARVRQLFPNTQAVGAAFGVILVRKGRSHIEVATFRADGKYVDGRRPEEVTFTTAEEDAKRRDFTINGMFLDPLKAGSVEEQVIDYVGGRDDLEAERIRAIGNPEERFEEDHLRMLRAIRFAARFDFRIEPQTAEAIVRLAPKLVRISPERIAEELRAMLTRDWPNGAWQNLFVRFPELSNAVFRFMGPPPPVEGRAEYRRVFGFAPLQGDERFPFGLCLAAVALDWRCLQQKPSDIRQLLTRDAVQQMSRALRQSLRISNEEAEEMEGALEGLGMLLAQHPPRVATAKRFHARPTSMLSRKLLRPLAQSRAQQRSPDEWQPSGGWETAYRELDEMLDSLSRTDYAPSPLLTGDDLTAAGEKPGRAFKRVLDAVYDAQLEDRVSTKEAALAMGLSMMLDGA